MNTATQATKDVELPKQLVERIARTLRIIGGPTCYCVQTIAGLHSRCWHCLSQEVLKEMENYTC